MQTNKFFGSILIIAGTSIGAAMLALPVTTAEYGIIPSLLLFVLSWAGMTLTGLLLLEVNLWLKPGSNIVSMAAHTLGGSGKIITSITYLLLFYALMAAYVSGMGDLVQKAITGTFNWQIYNGSGSFLMIFLVGIAVYFGTHSVDYLNRLFFAGKVISYIVLILFLLPYIQLPQLTATNVHHIWIILPIVVTSFGFHNVIPSLRVYLKDDVKKLRLAIIIGSTIPLIIYILWEIAILGVVPTHGKEGLLAALASGQPATGLASSLNHTLQNSWIGTLFKVFTVCAIATSFIGVSFSLFDFLIDSFSIKRSRPGKIFTLLLTFVPPLMFAFFYPNGFILALSYAGIFVAILFGILPVFMVWSGRYRKNIAEGYRVKMNKAALILILLFFIMIMLT